MKDGLEDWLALLKKKTYPARQDAPATPFVPFNRNVKKPLKRLVGLFKAYAACRLKMHIMMNGDAK